MRIFEQTNLFKKLFTLFIFFKGNFPCGKVGIFLINVQREARLPIINIVIDADKINNYIVTHKGKNNKP